MYIEDHDYGADTHCVHCGKAIYFDVGISDNDCPSCGKNYEKTDEQLVKEQEDDEAYLRKLQTPEYWDGELAKELANVKLYIDLAYNDMPLASQRKAAYIRRELNKMLGSI